MKFGIVINELPVVLTAYTEEHSSVGISSHFISTVHVLLYIDMYTCTCYVVAIKILIAQFTQDRDSIF